MRQFFVISEAISEEEAKRLIKFLNISNMSSYIPCNFNLLALDTLEEVEK